MESSRVHKHQFGAFGGVFTPCILTIIGAVMFLRSNFVTGESGVIAALSILLIGKSITSLTAISTSAIVTNMEMRGGGAYYIISRVLGPEFGGAIGVTLFLAQSVAVSFHILGFSEALVIGLPALKPYYAMITLGTALAIFVITYVGADWSIKVQYLIMAVLGLSIFMFLIGAATRFSTDTFMSNLWTAPPGTVGAGQYTFWQLFAIYFPSVTGFLVGINMSGDLKNPARSIPIGILSAIGAGALIYAIQIVLFAGAFSREALISRPYLTIHEAIPFGMTWLVTAGMFAAALSSAMGTHMSAPRVLQAIARDNLLPFLNPFSAGAQKGDEPRRAVVLVGIMTFLTLGISVRFPMDVAFNTVAQTITLFFVATYGLLNTAAFIEAYSENPSFRPRFRYFHYSTAFIGGMGCVFVALIINPLQALCIVGILIMLMRHIKRRQLQTTYGDARRGFYYRNVRTNLLRLDETRETPKNWRPTCLVFSGRPESRDELVSYGVWFESGRGLVFLVQILPGNLEQMMNDREEALTGLRIFCRDRNIQAFPVVSVDTSIESGIVNVMQNLAVGPVRPNLAIFGWSRKEGYDGTVTPKAFRMAHQLGMATAILRTGTHTVTASRRRVDVWWRGLKNGSLMLLLAHLLGENWEWKQQQIRLLRVVGDESEREETIRHLEELIHRARIKALPVVMVSGTSFTETIRRESSDAHLVILGFEIPEETAQEAWRSRYEALMPESPDVVLISSPGNENVFS